MVTYRSLLNEGIESKNMRAAKHYIYDFIKRNDERKAMEIIGGIKHDIPNSRLAKCKFMLGVTRMFMTGQLSNAEGITSLNRTLKYVATEAHVNEYNQDLNGLSAEKLIERFSQTITDDLEAEKRQMSARQYTRNNEYDIVKIKDFDMACEYGDYTDWCVTQYEDNFNAYTGGGLGVFYFCLKKGFQNVERVKGENCPLDEYGLSMIAVSVNYDGSCNTITCRWNHENGGNDNIMSVTQLSDLLGCNFYGVFLPKTDEEIKEFTQNVNMEIKEQLESEDAFVYETFPYKDDVDGEFHDAVLVVQAQAYGQYEYEDRVLYIMDSDYNLLCPQSFDYVIRRLGDLISTSSNRESAKVFNLASREFVKLPRYGSMHLFTLDGKNVLINGVSSHESAIFDREGNVLIDGYKYISLFHVGGKSKYLFAINFTKEGDRLDVYNENIQRIFDKPITYWCGATGFPFIFFKFEGEDYIRIFDEKTMKQMSDITFESLGGYKSDKYIVNLSSPTRSVMIDKNYNIYNRKTEELIGNLLSTQDAMKMQESKNCSKKIVLTEEQFGMLNERMYSSSLLNEGVETKNISAAKHYLYNFMRSDDERKAMEIIGDIKHDIPNSRLAKCKFMLGVVRMFLNRELNDAVTIDNLDATLKLVFSDKHVNEFDRDLNGVSCNELIQMFSNEMDEILDAERKEINGMKFTNKSEYDIVRIDSFDEASEYSAYVRWCVTESEDAFDAYTNDGCKQFYFCLKHGFEGVPEEKGEGCPLDEYGLSMIAVLVNENGSLASCTCRWNHDNGGNGNVLNAKQVSKVVDVNFYEVFKPNNKWKEKLADAMEMLARGVNPKYVFDECKDFKEGFAVVELNGKWNFLTNDRKFLSDTWFDECYDFENGLAYVELNDKENFITTDGKFLSGTWFDYCQNFKNGLAYVSLDGKSNFISTEGKFLSDIWFDRCSNFEDGFARVELNGKHNFLNTDGKILSDIWFDYCDYFKNGLAVVKLNNKWNVLTTDRKFLSDTWFDFCSNFSYGFARVKLNGKWNFLTTDGKIVSDTWFDRCEYATDGIYDVKINGKYITFDPKQHMQTVEGKATNKDVILTEEQFATLMNRINEYQDMLLEGGDSRLKPIKNIIRTAFEGTALNPDDYVPSAEYYVPNRGEQTTWMHYLIYSLRHRFDLMGNGDVPLLRNVAKIAFLELNFEKENQDLEKVNILDRIIQLIKKDEESKLNFIQNKDVTFSELYSQYSDILQQMDDEQVNTVNSKTYERNSNYEIVPINDFYTASEYGEYTGADGIGCLCYTTGRGTWDSFTNNGRNQCYLCHLQNYKEIPPIQGKGYPKDEYGLSMIWLFVNEMGRLVYSNVRWNHGDHTYDKVDNIFTESEISDIVGVNFYETFKPNNKWLEITKDLERRVAKGDDPNDIFDDYRPFLNGYAVVKFDNGCNYLTPEGKILSKIWFDYCYGFKSGFGVVGNDDKFNYITMDGRILSDTWFDELGEFRNGFAKVRLDDDYNFLTKDGKFLSDTWFDDCDDFEEGFAKVELNDKQNYLNTEGKILSEVWFDFARDFENDVSIISLDDKYNALRMDGKLLSDVWLDECYDFKHNMTAVQLNEKWNLLKKEGGFVSDKWFDFACVLENGEGLVKIDNKCYMIDTQGNMSFLTNA